MTDSTDPPDIVAFIEARLAEDEARALAASPGPWHPNDEHTEVLAVDDIEVCSGFALSNNQWRATVDHIVDNDPPTTLRRNVMIRAMLQHAEDAGDNERALEEEAGWRVRDLEKSPFADVRMHRDIAAYWSTHPDYRQEWTA